MKELSKEDKERIEKEAISTQPTKTFIESIYRTMFERGAKYEHPIAFQQGETKGFNESLDVIKKHVARIQKLESEITDLKLELESEVNLKERGFNEGIEAAKNRLKLMEDNQGDIYSNLEYVLDELEKLKK